MNKYKLFMIISIIILILSIGGSMAFFGWKAEDEASINVTVAGGNGSCSVKEDNNVFLEPTFTKNGGRIITLKAKQDLASKAVISWNMVIKEIDGLNDKSFKYEMINTLTGASYGSGTFENITEGSTITFSNTNEVLALGIEYEFALYLWIDGNAGNNPLSMADQILDFDMQCNLTSTDTGTYIGTNMLMIVDSSLGKADTEVFLRRNEEGQGLLRNQIDSVTFVENIEVPEGYTSIDVSQNEDESVIMWYGNPNSSGRYDVYIAGANGKTIIRDGANLFRRLTNVTTINFNNAIDTSNMISIKRMFERCTNLTSIDFSGVVTSNVIDMMATFNYCQNIVTLNIKEWDTSNVTTMYATFNNCHKLNIIDISSWNTSKVKEFNLMFQNCENLVKLDVNNWDTSNVTTMRYMFNMCFQLSEIDVSNWDTGRVTEMNNMFANCKSLTYLDLSNWNVSNVTNMSSMFALGGQFEGSMALTSIGDVSNWDTSNVTSMYCMFQLCSNLEALNVSNWNTSEVTNMAYMFFECLKLEILDLSNWDTSKVTSMMSMFNGCTILNTIYVGDNWSTSTVIESIGMFNRCPSLVGGSGTTFNEKNTDATYARVDKGPSSPGYFTNKAASA